MVKLRVNDGRLKIDAGEDYSRKSENNIHM
jgi:hypothetical protein